MGRSFEFRIRTELAAPAGDVWRHATSMAGVNEELAPWVRMTHPPRLADLSSGPLALGEVLFHSWLLAFGWVPFDRQSLRLLSVDDRGDGGGAFVENSTSWMQRRWRHERSVDPVGDGCVVEDRLVVEPRLPVGALARPVVAALFAHRHRQLVRRFGAPAGAGAGVPDGPTGVRRYDRAAARQRRRP